MIIAARPGAPAADLQAQVEALAAQVLELRQRLEQLEQDQKTVRITSRFSGESPRDQAEAALLLRIADVCGDTVAFTAAHVFKHAKVDPTLAAALLRADVDNAKQLGQRFLKLEHGPPVQEWQLTRFHDSRARAGILWSFRRP